MKRRKDGPKDGHRKGNKEGWGLIQAVFLHEMRKRAIEANQGEKKGVSRAPLNLTFRWIIREVDTRNSSH